jgi:hypothetical protein
MGSKLNLFPEKVYLRAGTRAGRALWGSMPAVPPRCGKI